MQAERDKAWEKCLQKMPPQVILPEEEEEAGGISGAVPEAEKDIYFGKQALRRQLSAAFKSGTQHKRELRRVAEKQSLVPVTHTLPKWQGEDFLPLLFFGSCVCPFEIPRLSERVIPPFLYAVVEVEREPWQFGL